MFGLLKIAAVVIAALIAIRIILGVLSFVTSFWFILVAAAALWFVLRNSKQHGVAE